MNHTKYTKVWSSFKERDVYMMGFGGSPWLRVSSGETNKLWTCTVLKEAINEKHLKLIKKKGIILLG